LEAAYQETEPYQPTRAEAAIRNLSREMVIDENDIDQGELQLDGWQKEEQEPQASEKPDQRKAGSPSSLVM